MDKLEKKKVIKSLALNRIASVFDVDPSQLTEATKLDSFVLAEKASMLKRGSLDIVLDDIHDAADKRIMKRLRAGDFNICTVQDYCNYMLECYEHDEKLVELVLGKIET